MNDLHTRFLDKVIKTDTCWLWIAGKHRGGYGHIIGFVNGKWKMLKAHRYSYEYFVRKIPDNYLVWHKCDNPSCVNPDHLFVGTAKDNSEDRINKGRNYFNRKGISIKNNKTLLSLEIAKQIRADFKKGLKYIDIQKKYKISKSQVSRIVLNQTWKESEEP